MQVAAKAKSAIMVGGLTVLMAGTLAGCQGDLTGVPGKSQKDTAQATNQPTDTQSKRTPDTTTVRDTGQATQHPRVDTAGSIDTASGGDGGDTSSMLSLPCDDGFTFSPDPLKTSEIIEINYKHPSQGYPYIGLRVSGPGNVEKGEGSVVSSSPPYHWRFKRTVDQGGTYIFEFTSEDQVKASCKKEVEATGAPPDIGDGGGGGGDDCLCGSGDGCEVCKMEGDCFDSPSKYHPDPNQSGWKCNDVAACVGSSCKIWCPFEPCDKPEGCSNNTEACYVPPGVTSYDEACRRCCESAPQNSTWNSQEHYCEVNR